MFMINVSPNYKILIFCYMKILFPHIHTVEFDTHTHTHTHTHNTHMGCLHAPSGNTVRHISVSHPGWAISEECSIIHSTSYILEVIWSI